MRKDELHPRWLVADFFTSQYRISGSVDVRSKRLADQLEDRTSTFLQLEDAYVSSLDQPADIVASHDQSTIRKDAIIAVITQNRDDALTRRQSYGSYRGVHLSKVFLIASPFDIHGYLRLSSKMDLRTVFTQGSARFLPVLDGQLRIAARPKAEFSGGALLINRARTEVFWLEDDGEEAHG